MSELKPRKIIPKIMDFMDDKAVIVLHGSRQVGKTSILLYLIEKYLTKKSDNSTFYFDLEDFALLDLCNMGPDRVVDYLRAKGANFSKKVFLLVDEIQYISNPSSFLKLFHDRYHNLVKLIVSGSSSFQIKKKFKDSLVGRIIDFELFPLDFEEFLEFRGNKYDLKSQVPPAVEDELRVLYEEFVLFGGYPAIVLERVLHKKEIKLKQIINTYIRKDIRDLADIRELDKFNNLIEILASQAGNLLNIMELSNTLRLAKKTTENYLSLLENTYILKRLRPFFSNIRSELTKMPKVFFEDTGLMNLISNRSFSMKMTGALLENSIYSQLRKNIDIESLYFWRTNKKQEIDFVIDFRKRNQLNKIIALEVKSLFLNKHTTSLRYFQKAYSLKKAYFCSLLKRENCKYHDIEVIYPWQVLSIFTDSP